MIKESIAHRHNAYIDNNKNQLIQMTEEFYGLLEQSKLISSKNQRIEDSKS
jgi:hypothetical protein